MGGLGTGSSSSTPTTVFTPGLFGYESTANGGVPAQGLMNQYLGAMGLSANAGGITGSLQQANPFTQQAVTASPLAMQQAGASPVTSQNSNISPQVSSAYGGELQKQLLNPSFNPNAVQMSLLNKANDMTNALSSARGLGASSDLEKMAALSPMLANFQQQNVSNLMGANQADISQQLAQNQFGLSQNQMNNQFGQAAQIANNQFGQNAAQLNNQANLGAANWLTQAQGLQGQLNNAMAGGNLAAQQQQQQNIMTALGLIAPGSSVAAQSQSVNEAKPGSSNPSNLNVGQSILDPSSSTLGQILNPLGAVTGWSL